VSPTDLSRRGRMPRAHQCRLAQLAASSCRKSPRIERLARRRSAKRKGNLQPWLSCGLSRPLPGVERRLLEPLHGLGKGGCCARWGVEPLRSSRIHASTDDGLASWPNHSRAPKLREDPAWFSFTSSSLLPAPGVLHSHITREGRRSQMVKPHHPTSHRQPDPR